MVGTDQITCPACAARIKAAAFKCRFCGHRLYPAPKAPRVLFLSVAGIIFRLLIFAQFLPAPDQSGGAKAEAKPASSSGEPSPASTALHSQDAFEKEIEKDTKPIAIEPKLPGDQCRSVWTDSVASFQDAVQDRMGPAVTVKPVDNRYYPPSTKGLRTVVMRFTAGDQEWVATGYVDPADCSPTIGHIKHVVRFLP